MIQLKKMRYRFMWIRFIFVLLLIPVSGKFVRKKKKKKKKKTCGKKLLPAYLLNRLQRKFCLHMLTNLVFEWLKVHSWWYLRRFSHRKC